MLIPENTVFLRLEVHIQIPMQLEMSSLIKAAVLGAVQGPAASEHHSHLRLNDITSLSVMEYIQQL